MSVTIKYDYKTQQNYIDFNDKELDDTKLQEIETLLTQDPSLQVSFKRLSNIKSNLLTTEKYPQL